MRQRPPNPHVRLALVFGLLVLAPSCLLGWFSLRAVESARVASQQRLQADYEQYAEFASRAVQQDLLALESAWEALVPRAVGWEERLDETTQALEAARGRAFVRRGYLMHASGARLHPAGEASAALVAADTVETRIFRQQMSAAEAAEYELEAPEAALAAYDDILARVRTPRLRAIAQASRARVLLQRGDWNAAQAAYETLLREHPDARDLDNQSLRVQAKLQIARALEETGELARAARTLVDLQEDLAARSDALGPLQFDIVTERIAGRMRRLLPALPSAERASVEPAYETARARAKKSVGPDYFQHKLSRKLLRAVLDDLRYSTRVRYLSDTVEGRPFLLAYLFMPDRSGTAIAGLLGLEIDLRSLSDAVLPAILEALELGDAIDVAIVDEAGQRVTETGTHGTSEARVASHLGEPFDFWSVALFVSAPMQEARIDFRTKVFLYFVLLLLVTIAAGASLVMLGLRRESRLSKLKTGFVSNVSHELRTPLTSIRMFVEMLQMGGERMRPEQRGRYLHTIRRECERLQRLIDAILDFARMERGAREYRFEFEEIGELVRAVAEDFRAQAEAAGFEYRVEIAPDLPEVRVDADALRQMLLNLLSNAVKYSDERRWIAVRVLRRERALGIQVEDHGIGIDAHEQERIFEDFYRVDTSAAGRVGGVGLGLTLVRRMAAAHGGAVRVDSTPGRGSTFTVWLPFDEESSLRAEQARTIEA
ncbi:MAG: HAMP domain-containing histidine kinase [Candidatus Latescibacterota bacterium]|nr:MAG: HAMP domain-containing histidine kinase [Candidatus Latescibacterota bacterium]